MMKAFVRLITQSNGSGDITLTVKPLGERCYYLDPRIISSRVLDDSKTNIIAKGDGKSYEHLAVTKTDSRFYLHDISRRDNGLATSVNIQTLKSIGLGELKLTRHSAELAEGLNQSGVDAHANSIVVYDYLKNILGLNSYDNQGSSMAAITDYLLPHLETDPNPGSQFNASYSNNSIYYTPAIPTKGYDKSLSSIVNVAAHEWGHAITSRNSNLIYSRESDALNEAFSDWLGIAIERSTGTDNWLIGFADNPFRSMKNPENIYRIYREKHDYKIIKDGAVYQPSWILEERAYYPNTYKGDNWLLTDATNCATPSDYNNLCGVHINSSVANKMFYLLSVGGC